MYIYCVLQFKKALTKIQTAAGRLDWTKFYFLILVIFTALAIRNTTLPSGMDFQLLIIGYCINVTERYPRRHQRFEICVHSSTSHYNYKHSIFSVSSYYNHR